MREWRRRKREYRLGIGEGLPECSEGILLFVLGGELEYSGNTKS